MRWADYDSRTCSISRTLDVLGDRWTPLILRDLFNDVHRFDDLHRHLGIARDILTKRLNVLIAAGVVDRIAYQEHGTRTRHEYRLTDAGRELRPVLLALMAWGDKHLADQEGPPVTVTHRDCGAPVHVSLTCENNHNIGSGEALVTTHNLAVQATPSTP